MRRSAALPLLLVLVVACDLITTAPPRATTPAPGPSASAPTATPPLGAPVVGDMTAALQSKPLPVADSFALARSVRGRDGQPAKAFEPVRQTPPAESVGSRHEFWVYDWDAKKNFSVNSTLRAMTPNVKWWIVDGISVDQADLDRAAAEVETRTLPNVRKAYGSEWSPGIDADPRMNILVAEIPGQAAGYYSSTDEQPRWVYEFSAEREIVFINMPRGGRLATDGLYGTIAHEICHMIQFNKRARSIVWFSEGQAELCSRSGSPATSSGFEGLFLQQPDTQLNDWPELGNISALHYGGSFLFLEFLRQHAGGEDLINAFLAKGIDTPDDLDKVLRARGQPGLEELFADFIVANTLLRETADDRYKYVPGMARLGTPAGPTAQDRVTQGGTLRTKVQPYGARYIELPREKATLRFDGTPSARVIPTDAHSGTAFWWSDRADVLDSTLDRTVDLRSARAPILKFWTWYQIEADFDYAYIEVSTDGGQRWTTLKATSTTATDPNGVNLGQGLSGVSGGGRDPAWVEQSVDLAAFAGKEILLRFQYVTDGALNLHGIAIDDLEIAEIGWRDNAETDADWKANGFVRSTNVVKQRFVVQLIRFGARAIVERHVVPDGRFELPYDASGDRRPPLVAVTAFAARTTAPATFTIEVRP